MEVGLFLVTSCCSQLRPKCSLLIKSFLEPLFIYLFIHYSFIHLVWFCDCNTLLVWKYWIVWTIVRTVHLIMYFFSNFILNLMIINIMYAQSTKWGLLSRNHSSFRKCCFLRRSYSSLMKWGFFYKKLQFSDESWHCI